MRFAFDASVVSCVDAMDGEILQVNFDTVPTIQDEDGRRTPYVLISRNFEFPDAATIEWHDGQGYDGGGEIVSVILHRDRVSIKLDRGLEIDVGFNLPDKQFAELTSLLTSP